MDPVRKLDKRIAKLEKELRDSMAETGPLHSRTQDQAYSGVGTTQKSSQHAYDQSTHIYKHH